MSKNFYVISVNLTDVPLCSKQRISNEYKEMNTRIGVISTQQNMIASKIADERKNFDWEVCYDGCDPKERHIKGVRHATIMGLDTPYYINEGLKFYENGYCKGYLTQEIWEEISKTSAFKANGYVSGINAKGDRCALLVSGFTGTKQQAEKKALDMALDLASNYAIGQGVRTDEQLKELSTKDKLVEPKLVDENSMLSNGFTQQDAYRDSKSKEELKRKSAMSKSLKKDNQDTFYK